MKSFESVGQSCAAISISSLLFLIDDTKVREVVSPAKDKNEGLLNGYFWFRKTINVAFCSKNVFYLKKDLFSEPSALHLLKFFDLKKVLFKRKKFI